MRLILLVLIGFASPKLLADKYRVDPSNSSVEFGIGHMNSTERGGFGKFDGHFEFDPKNISAAYFELKIDAASINTNDVKRDEHLRGPDFFDVKHHQEIRFTSKKVESTSGSAFKISGELYMKGKSCPISIEANYAGETKDKWGATRAEFVGTTRINRLAWGIKWNRALVGDNVPKVKDLKDSCDFNQALDNEHNGKGWVLGTVVDINLKIKAINLTQNPPKS